MTRSILSVLFLAATVLFAADSTALASGGSSTTCSPTASTSHFTVDYQGVVYNPDGTSTWTYTVVWDGWGSDLDKFMLKLCHDADVVSSSPAGAWVGYNSSLGMYGIKWHTDDIVTQAGVPYTFSVTLDQAYAVAKTKVALKSWYYPHYLHICGPSKYCTLEMLPPQDLVCDVDPCTGETIVTWSNITPYDLINVRVDGALVETLPGNTTSTILTLGSGSHSIEVTGVDDHDDDGEYDHCDGYSPYTGGGWGGGHDDDDDDHDDDDDDEDDDGDDCDEDDESDPAICMVDVPDNTPVAPSYLTCTADLLNCSVAVSWTNERTYTEIVLSVDGVPYVTLPGSATSFVVPDSLIGTHTICLDGIDDCGNSFPQVCCTFSCDDPSPPPVTDLLCLPLDVCDFTATASWTNGAADYDSLDVLVDGALVATLPGSAMMTTVSLGGPGSHTICVVPYRNGFSGDQACCNVTIDPVANGVPTALNCDAPPSPNCAASVTWLNGGEYSQIEVFLDGMLFETLPGIAQSTTVAIPDTGLHQICIRATTICDEVLADVCCTVDCIGPPDPIAGLTCSLDDICTCAFSLTWMNGNSDYDEIQVFIDGVLHEQIPGSATLLPLVLPTTGPAEICLVPVRAGLTGPATCCTVDCPGVPVEMVQDLTCTPDPLSCVFTVDWTNPVAYSQVTIALDGTIVATLSGADTTYTFGMPLTGMHEICVTGTTICGDVTAAACCSVDCTIPPPDPVTDLVCGTVDPCTCTLAVAWTNTESNYDAIQVIVEGVLDQTLPGNATNAVVTLPGADTYAICIVPVRNGVSGMAVCCKATCPITDPIPPTVLECTVDATSCDATINWLNNALYSQVEVRLNGTVVQVVPGADATATVNLTLPGQNTLSLVATTVCGVVTDEVSCKVTCPGLVPPPITGLTCTLDDVCTCTYTATWTNGGMYDEIQVIVDGALAQTLLGDATMTTLSVGAPGVHEVCIVPIVNLVPAGPECCTVDCPDVPLLPPNGLSVTVGDSPTCETTLTWMNNSDYSQIVITLDGIPVDTVAGTATSATLNLPGPGVHTICLEATTICGDALPPTCADAECIFPPDPVGDLTCPIDVDPCSGTITWTNTNSDYDSIEVTLDGMLFATLPGNATMVDYGPLDSGVHVFCVTAIRNNLPSTEVCCTIDCPFPPNAPLGVTCTLDDFCTCDGTVTWTNADADYDTIEVTVDGVLVATLPGTATSAAVTLPQPGSSSVCVTAVRNALSSPPACCTLDCSGPPPLTAPTDLLCTTGPFPGCETAITWTNTSDYAQIVVTLDGAMVATLPGTATTTTVALTTAGPHDICLVATTTCGDVLAPVCCTTECIFPPDPIMNLTCPIDQDPCSGTITWTNANPDYDSIEVTLDGVPFATLPGDATMLAYGPLDPGPHEFCFTAVRAGLTSMVTCCTIDCPLPPDAPLNVTCTLDDLCACTGTVTWMNANADYDAIEVRVDGVLVETLPGTATSTMVTLPMPGMSDVCLTAVRNALSSPEACCMLDCSGRPPMTTPTDLVCTVGASPTCETTLSWTNTSDYSQIVVTLDGVAIETLPGTATGTTLNLADGDPHEVCLVATTICNDVLTPVCCTIECLFPAELPLNVTCTLDDVCTCSGTVSWTNANPDYDSIEVRVDGVLVATLPGTATEAMVTLPSPGSANVCVEAFRDGLGSGFACCTLDCAGPPAPISPSNLTCTVTDTDSCTVDLTWDNGMPYSQIQVLVGGVSVLTVAGTDTSATVNLMGMSDQVCLLATTECGSDTDLVCCTVECSTPFLRGDCNTDGFVDIADAIYIVRFLFNGFPPSSCFDACNHNNDMTLDISDTVFLINYIFLSGPTPQAPFQVCGVDGLDSVGCTSYPPCEN